MCSSTLNHTEWSFSNHSTGRQTYIHCLVGNKITNGSVLSTTCSIDTLTCVSIDVDDVMSDNTIGRERRAPLDVDGSGVYNINPHINWCISRS